MNMRTFDTFEALDQFLREPLFTVPTRTSFPPYNVIQTSDGNVVKIEVALAGYDITDVEVDLTDGKLHVRSAPEDRKLHEAWKVIHKGIAARKFDLTFAVNNNYEGESAEMADGILTITLKRVAGFAKKLEIKPKVKELKEVEVPPLLA